MWATTQHFVSWLLAFISCSWSVWIQQCDTVTIYIFMCLYSTCTTIIPVHMLSVRGQVFSLLCCDVEWLDAIVVTLWMVRILCWCNHTADCRHKPETFCSFVMARREMSFRTAPEIGLVGCGTELKWWKFDVVTVEEKRQDCECAIFIIIVKVAFEGL